MTAGACGRRRRPYQLLEALKDRYDPENVWIWSGIAGCC